MARTCEAVPKQSTDSKTYNPANCGADFRAHLSAAAGTNQGPARVNSVDWSFAAYVTRMRLRPRGHRASTQLRESDWQYA